MLIKLKMVLSFAFFFHNSKPNTNYSNAFSYSSECQHGHISMSVKLYMDVKHTFQEAVKSRLSWPSLNSVYFWFRSLIKTANMNHVSNLSNLEYFSRHFLLRIVNIHNPLIAHYANSLKKNRLSYLREIPKWRTSS